MAQIDWSKLAKEDLQEIYDYISNDSERYALRMVDRIVERTETLREHPISGRIVPEFENENLRELIEGNYRIIYYIVSKEQISIVRVYHGARLLKLKNL